MATRVGEAFVQLSTKDDKLKSGLSDAQRRVNSSVTGMQRDLDRLNADSASRSISALVTGIQGIGVAVAGASMGMLLREMVMLQDRSALLLGTFTKISGSSLLAGQELAFVRAEANRLGVSYYDLADAYKQVSAAAKGTSLEGEEVRKLFSAMNTAAASLGLGSEEAKRALTALSQMMSKGKVSAEELRQQLGEVLPGAFQVAARAMGVSTAALDKMLSEGKIMTDEFIPKFRAQVEKEFGGANSNIETSGKAVERLRNEFRDLGEGLSSGLHLSQGFQVFTNGLTDVVRLINETIPRLHAFGKAYKEAYESSQPKTGVDSLAGGLWKGITAPFSALYPATKAANAPIGQVQESIGTKPPTIQIDPEIARMKALSGEYAEFKKNNADYWKWFADSSKEAGKALESAATPAEKLNSQMAEYSKWLKEGVIDQDAFNKLVANAKETYEKTLDVPLAMTDVDKQFVALDKQITDALQNITAASSEYQISMAEASGDFMKAENIRWSQWEDERKTNFAQVVQTTAQAYEEIKQRIAAAAAVDPSLMPVLDAFQKKIDALKSQLPEYNRLIEDSAKAQRNFAQETKRLENLTTLTQLKKEYVDLTGSTKERLQAEKELLAIQAEQNALGKPKEIADAYREIAREQIRLKDVMQNGNYYQGMLEGIRAISREMKTMAEIGYEMARVIKDELVGGITDFIMGEKTASQAWQDLQKNITRQITEKMADKAMGEIAGMVGNLFPNGSGIGDAISSVFGLGSGKSMNAQTMNVTAASVTVNGGVSGAGGSGGGGILGQLGGMLGGLFGSGGSGAWGDMVSGGADWMGTSYYMIPGLHGGGIAGLNASFYRGWPKYHDGLAPDELPAILQRGEMVWSKKQVESMRNGGITQPKLEVKNQIITKDPETRVITTYVPSRSQQRAMLVQTSRRGVKDI